MVLNYFWNKHIPEKKDKTNIYGALGLNAAILW